MHSWRPAAPGCRQGDGHSGLALLPPHPQKGNACQMEETLRRSSENPFLIKSYKIKQSSNICRKKNQIQIPTSYNIVHFSPLGRATRKNTQKPLNHIYHHLSNRSFHCSPMTKFPQMRLESLTLLRLWSPSTEPEVLRWTDEDADTNIEHGGPASMQAPGNNLGEANAFDKATRY